MEKLGYGKNYKYAHNFPDHIVEQEHLPKPLVGKRFYVPSDQGREPDLGKRRVSREQRPASVEPMNAASPVNRATRSSSPQPVDRVDSEE